MHSLYCSIVCLHIRVPCVRVWVITVCGFVFILLSHHLTAFVIMFMLAVGICVLLSRDMTAYVIMLKLIVWEIMNDWGHL